MTEWRVIPTLPDYEVTEDGRVRRISTGHETTGWIDKHGYRRHKLRHEDRYVHIAAHQLVLLAYVGVPDPARRVGRHLDGDPTNNHVDNLRWGDQRENAEDTKRHGRDWHVNKTHCPRGHPYSEENTYIAPGNRGRNCRTCVQERNRAKYPTVRARRAERAADPYSLTHGLVSTYTNYRCRCEACSQAARDYNRARRKER